ncbi:MAG: choice-of-anchor D domain-containing protein, partial [Thiotrichaceae bacterium]|nr:choice-of-anchor D domain-containing protein [Thiotrichaceae bacterium]
MRYQNLFPDKSRLRLYSTGIFLLTLLFSLSIRANELIVPQDLTNEINQNYVARAIIGLKVDAQPEGELNGAAAIQDQRNTISQTQQSFLQELTQDVWGDLSFIGGVGDSAATIQAETTFETIPYLVLKVDSYSLSKIKENPKVASIQLDEMIPLSLAQSVPLVGANKAWTKGHSGSGYAVAVLDTGVDKTHPMLSGKVIAEACYSTTSSLTSSVCPNGSNSQIGNGAGMPCSSSLSGCYHGTHVAGIVAGDNGILKGVAKDSKIVAVQVFSRYGTGVTAWSSDQIKGLEYVLSLHKNGTKIASVNMSLGSRNVYAAYCDGIQPATKAVIDNLRSVGIATIIASGNSSSSTGISSPACISSAISVGATAKNDVVASYSNSIAFLKLLAPGSSIVSSMPGNRTSALNGTSMAAPHVAGAFSVLKAASPSSTVNEILSCLQTTGKSIRDGRNNITKPRIQVDEALTCLLPAPDIKAAPTVLDFGNVTVDSSTAFQTVTITNSGNADLNITGLSISSSEFVLQNNTCKTVVPSKSCTFQVVFKPKIAGVKASNVVISSNDPDTASLSILLKGNSFADCAINATAGKGGTISPSGSIISACGTTRTYTITPSSGYKVLNVLVDNKLVGAVSSHSVKCDCPNGTNVRKTIAASFAALIPNIAVTPTSANFGEILVNKSSSAKSFTVSNTGDANLQLGKITVSNSEFVLADNCSNKSLAPKSSCAVTVTFKPTNEGSRSGTMVVPSNDPDTAKVNVSLQGTGKKGAPLMDVSPTSINFGDVEIGKSSETKTITVTNKGTAVMYIAVALLEGTNKADFTIVSTTCAAKTFIPNQSCTIELQLKPGTEGQKTAQLKIVSPNAGNKLLSLVGNGIIIDTLACSATPTITSKGTGNWSSASTWDANRIPNRNDVVLIEDKHSVTLPYYSYMPSVKGVCNHGTIWNSVSYWKWRYYKWRWFSWWRWRWYHYYAGNSRLHASDFIDNHGQIRGTNSINSFSWWWSSRRAGNLYLYSNGEFTNYPKALVKGGDGITRGTYGAAGGNVYIRAAKIHNYGTYGTSSFGSILGGHGANGSYRGGHGGYAYTIAYNGYLKNGGIICAGNGGSGRYAGIGGRLYVNGRPYTRLNGGTLCTGKNGSGRIDPNVISLAGKDTKIEGGDITIFGGKDFVIDLTDMSEGAISTESLTLAVGPGGMIDLRGSNAKILSVKGELKIFSDNIMLDEGVMLEDIVQADKITVAPAKIIYDLTVDGPESIAGKAGDTLPIALMVTNTGPETDSYTVSLANSKGWNLSQVPSTFTVESQQTEEFNLDISLPEEEGENTVLVTVTSQNDTDVSKTLEIRVHSANEVIELSVNDDGTVDLSPITDDLSEGGDTSQVDENGDLIGIQPIGSYNIGGTILDASGNPMVGVTVKAGDQVSVSDDVGNWAIGGLDQGDYAVTASKAGHSFNSVDVSLEGEETLRTVTLQGEVSIFSVRGSLKDNKGSFLPNVTIRIGNISTVTSSNGTFEVTSLTNGDYIVTASVDGHAVKSQNITISGADVSNVELIAINLVDYKASGHLSDEQGNPFVSAVVQVGDKITTTDSNGYWEITGLEERQYEAIARINGYTFEPLSFITSHNTPDVTVEMSSPTSALDATIEQTPTLVLEGEPTLTYTIEVKNNGHVTATGITLV